MFFRLKAIIICLIFVFVSSASFAATQNTILKDLKYKNYEQAYQSSLSHVDPLFKRMVEWFYLNNVEDHDYSFDQFERFLTATKNWPNRGKIILQAEKKLMEVNDKKRLLKWFEKYSPRTQEAFYLHFETLVSFRYKEKAYKAVRDYWVKATFSKKDRQSFYQRFKHILRKKDHELRLERLLWDRHFDSAKALLPMVDKSLRNLAKARIALAEKKVGVDLAIQAVAPKYMNNEGLVYERVRWRRDKKLNDGVVSLLKTAPDQMKYPKKWWRERHIVARRFMSEKDYKKAYDLVSSHRQTSGFSYAQAEWLSGWLALRYLNQPVKAYEHFSNMEARVKSPVSRSRALYWKGIAAQALSKGDESVDLLSKAARYSTRFYAQLAYTRLHEKQVHHSVTSLPLLDQSLASQAHLSSDFQKIISYLHQGGLDSEKRAFFNRMIDQAKGAADVTALFKLAQKYDGFHARVRLSKKATSMGYIALDDGYPVFDEAVDQASFQGVEPALIYALIRQESSFDPEARSSVGARGLMQLMPATAKDVADKLKVPYRLNNLNNPDYNIKLGSSYIAQMLERFEGYYVLAIAAYNAGPSRVESIMKEIGDPRKGDVDIVDWIESIPIYETRNYVQRVLEAMHIYRSKLTEKNSTIAIGEN